jgi:hypothetical protein
MSKRIDEQPIMSAIAEMTSICWTALARQNGRYLSIKLCLTRLFSSNFTDDSMA